MAWNDCSDQANACTAKGLSKTEVAANKAAEIGKLFSSPLSYLGLY